MISFNKNIFLWTNLPTRCHLRKPKEHIHSPHRPWTTWNALPRAVDPLAPWVFLNRSNDELIDRTWKMLNGTGMRPWCWCNELQTLNEEGQPSETKQQVSNGFHYLVKIPVRCYISAITIAYFRMMMKYSPFAKNSMVRCQQESLHPNWQTRLRNGLGPLTQE